MFAIPENGGKINPEDVTGKRHCILVTASNPFPLPVPIFRPNIDGSGIETVFAKIETVAHWFEQCSVSLSVISARKLPNVRAIHDAANHNNNPPQIIIEKNHNNNSVGQLAIEEQYMPSGEIVSAISDAGAMSMLHQHPG